MARSTPVFYVFHGADAFTIAETLKDFKHRLGPPEAIDLNTTVLEGRKQTIVEIRQACDTVPFLADKRLIVVYNLLTQWSSRGKRVEPNPVGESLNTLVEYLPHLPNTARLVFVEDTALPENHPVIRLAERTGAGYVKRFDLPDSEGLPRWIAERAREHGGEIDPAAARQLATLVDDDLRLLDQEITKLVIHAGGERAITVTDVAHLVPYAQAAVIFDLVDALGRRDGKIAARTLHGLLEMGEHPLGILAMVVRQFRLLLQLKDLEAAGASLQDAIRTLRLHPFPARKLHRQATYFTAAQLEQVYRYLLEIDVAIKTGQTEAEVALDLLIAGLALDDG
jgi:DNA polymerase-3 subunit delta